MYYYLFSELYFLLYPLKSIIKASRFKDVETASYNILSILISLNIIVLFENYRLDPEDRNLFPQLVIVILSFIINHILIFPNQQFQKHIISYSKKTKVFKLIFRFVTIAYIFITIYAYIKILS